jgi:hypothetical protein
MAIRDSISRSSATHLSRVIGMVSSGTAGITEAVEEASSTGSRGK